MNIFILNKSTNAVNLWFDDVRMVVCLEDGREIAVPLDWFPGPGMPPISKKTIGRLIGDGEGIHWEAPDEDMLVEGLLK